MKEKLLRTSDGCDGYHVFASGGSGALLMTRTMLERFCGIHTVWLKEKKYAYQQSGLPFQGGPAVFLEVLL